MPSERINYAIKFPDERNKGKTLLKKIQIVELRILKIFDDICRRNRIDYFLLAGTLLGAIRHRGFIPWDDDVDVIMPREDYEKLVKVIKKELPEDLFWQDIHTDNFPHFRMLFGKIRDKNSQMEKNDNYHTGVFLDIFILEKLSPNPKVAKIQQKYLSFLCHLDLLKNKKSFVQQIRIKKITSKNIIFKEALVLFARFFERFLNRFDIPSWLRTRYYRKIRKKNYVYSWYFGGKNINMKKEDIFPLKKVKFEDAKLNVPNNYEKFLRRFYGDYMTPPPKNLRKPGHIIIKETFV